VRLARDGALVAVHYGISKAAAEETLGQIRHEGGQGFTVGAELGVTGDAERLWAGFDASLRATGSGPGLDIIVNNAAVGASADYQNVTAEDFGHLLVAEPPEGLAQRAALDVAGQVRDSHVAAGRQIRGQPPHHADRILAVGEEMQYAEEEHRRWPRGVERLGRLCQDHPGWRNSP
jgi:NAD(P)-dependent dehydrogenase (short-subunit alcohol dehydrogenase family)